MKEIVTKLVKIEKKISAEKGPFNLFALFLRGDTEDKWDLLVSSKWISNDKYESLKYISSEVQKGLDQEELVKISRIVVIDCGNPELDAINSAIAIEHGNIKIDNCNFFGFIIRRAYIISSKKSCSQQIVQ